MGLLFQTQVQGGRLFCSTRVSGKQALGKCWTRWAGCGLESCWPGERGTGGVEEKGRPSHGLFSGWDSGAWPPSKGLKVWREEVLGRQELVDVSAASVLRNMPCPASLPLWSRDDGRGADNGSKLPSWLAVQGHKLRPWGAAHILWPTAGLSFPTGIKTLESVCGSVLQLLPSLFLGALAQASTLPSDPGSPMVLPDSGHLLPRTLFVLTHSCLILWVLLRSHLLGKSFPNPPNYIWDRLN